ncbi:MAG: starch-binding protein [Lachnospiraceae bacterium]|nr:starch-binding protein [Lachnospiraceae bacterium]
MKKIWRKFSVVLLAALFAVLTVPAAAFATEVSATAEGMRLIYANVPEDWASPCVWAWNEAGDTAFAAWPGEAMDADASNAGWYYLYVPDWADHVIINANAGEVQTEEIVLESGNAWITVTDAQTFDATTEQKTSGDLPEYVETFKIHAKVDESWENPCLWAWSAPDGTNAFEAWPGQQMSAGEDGWYTTKAPTWINSIIVNGNAGEVQTEDISVDPAELWLTISADGAYELSYVDPELAEIPNITVHVQAPADWDTPNLWAWSAPDGTNVYTTWPGEALESNGDWLTKEIPGWVNSIIVNANGGEVQTSDISIEAGKDVWVVVSSADEFELYYEEPAATETVDAAGATESTEAPETRKEKSNKMPIVGGVIGVVAIAGIAGGTAYAVNKKKKSA